MANSLLSAGRLRSLPRGEPLLEVAVFFEHEGESVLDHEVAAAMDETAVGLEIGKHVGVNGHLQAAAFLLDLLL
ncbi:MAG: hypothetical protein ACRD2E_01595 [Terriglobales bacterium]